MPPLRPTQSRPEGTSGYCFDPENYRVPRSVHLQAPGLPVNVQTQPSAPLLSCQQPPPCRHRVPRPCCLQDAGRGTPCCGPTVCPALLGSESWGDRRPGAAYGGQRDARPEGMAFWKRDWESAGWRTAGVAGSGDGRTGGDSMQKDTGWPRLAGSGVSGVQAHLVVSREGAAERVMEVHPRPAWHFQRPRAERALCCPPSLPGPQDRQPAAPRTHSHAQPSSAFCSHPQTPETEPRCGQRVAYPG